MGGSLADILLTPMTSYWLTRGALEMASSTLSTIPSSSGETTSTIEADRPKAMGSTF